MKTTYAVTGMKCGGCQSAVTDALKGVDGVSSVNVSLENASAEVEASEDVKVETLKEAVAKAGFALE